MDSIRKQKLDHAKRTSLSLVKEHHEQASIGAEPSAPQHYRKVLFEWHPKEFHEHKKGENWYLWLGIITAIFITIAIFTAAYIVAVTFFLLAVVIVMFAQRPAETIDVKITDTGIEKDDRFYPYHTLEKFWIFYNPPHVTRLHIRQKTRLMPDLHIEIEDQDPVALRDALLEYLPEDEAAEENFTDTVARRLRF
jgi:hypothetical protein